MATKDAAFISISAMRNLLIFYSIFCLHCKLRCAQDIAQQGKRSARVLSDLRKIKGIVQQGKWRSAARFLTSEDT